MKEPDLKVILFRRLEALGVQVINRTMAMQLLTNDRQIVGAVGMNVRTGDLVVCKAKSTILTTGGAARFGLPNNGYLYGTFDFPGNVGDGYVMAFRAGAHLTGLEYTGASYLIKDMNAPLLYITLTRGARLLNALGQDITGGHPGSTRMFAEHRKDMGPLCIRMKHLPESKIAEVEDILFSTERPVMQRFFEGRGVDFRHSDIELSPTEFYLCGGHGVAGIQVNDRAETSVAGLYAAGDVANVARGHLSGAFTFGEIAAENATLYARDQSSVTFDSNQVTQIQARLAAIEERRGKTSIEEFEYKVRRIINDYAIPPKNQFKLEQALNWMERFRHEIGAGVSVGDAHDVFKILEVENIIACATLSATASEARKESRWGFFHYRSDYPERDDRQWLKHVVLQKGERDEDIRVTYQPVERRKVQ
jgi:succinate dehydrogenase/fumarate reductase flavoprotein subunit